jgi:hypothetical protein
MAVLVDKPQVFGMKANKCSPKIKTAAKDCTNPWDSRELLRSIDPNEHTSQSLFFVLGLIISFCETL